MPFFRDLRRRSKASFHTTRSNGSKSNDSKSNDSQCNGGMASAKSSSTLDTSSYKSATPPPSIRPNRSSPNLPSLTEFNGNSESSSGPPAVPPPRPGPFVHQLQRNSTIVCFSLRPFRLVGNNNLTLQGSSSHSINGGIRSPTPSSPYAPRIVSISDNSWVRAFVSLVLCVLGSLGVQYVYMVH